MMKSKIEIAAWCLYDFANSSFATIILTVAYGIFFKEILCGGRSQGDFLWGLSLSLGYTCAAICAPILGAFSDETGSRKKLLMGMTLLCVFSTGLLYFLEEGMILAGMILFILGFFGFALGNVFYNAFLLDITETLGRISGLGWGLGYLGGLVTLGLFYPWISKNKFEISFLFTAFFFLIFSLPTFIFLKSGPVSQKRPFSESVRMSLNRIHQTRKDISEHRELLKFLVAYFFYNDGLSTVITFSSLYARSTFQMTMQEITALFFFLQITSLLGAFVSGFFVDRFGAKKTILWTLGIWIFTVLGAYFAQTKTSFWIISSVAGLGLGSSQSASRSYVALATPISKVGEFFGFFAIFTKFSSILGPFIFGLSSHVLGQRNAILTILFFFLIGAILLLRVKDKKLT
jgi:UMF1 family MFS transporter